MQARISQNKLKQLKQEATRMKKELGINHSRALDILAQERGYKCWGLLMKYNGSSGSYRAGTYPGNQSKSGITAGFRPSQDKALPRTDMPVGYEQGTAKPFHPSAYAANTYINDLPKHVRITYRKRLHPVRKELSSRDGGAQ